MFKQITIELTGPICSCDERSISWTVHNPRKGLLLKCRKCGVELHVPIDHFVAVFRFDDIEEQKARRLTAFSGGKVLPMPIEKDDDDDPSAA